VTGCDDGHLRVFDLAEAMRSSAEPPPPELPRKLSSSVQQIEMASRGSTVVVQSDWDVTAGVVLCADTARKLSGFKGPQRVSVRAMSVSPSGKLIAVGFEGYVGIWTVGSERPQWKACFPDGDDERVGWVGFNDSESVLLVNFSSDHDDNAGAFSIPAIEPSNQEATTAGDKEDTNSEDDEDDGLDDVTELEILWRVSSHDNVEDGSAVGPEWVCLAAEKEDDPDGFPLWIRSLADGTALGTLQYHARYVTSNGNHLIALNERRRICVYFVNPSGPWPLQARAVMTASDSCEYLTITHDGQLFAAFTNDRIHVYALTPSPTPCKPRLAFVFRADPKALLQGLELVPCGNSWCVVGADTNGHAYVWALVATENSDGTAICRFSSGQENTTCTAMAARGSTVVMGFRDGSFFLLKLSTSGLGTVMVDWTDQSDEELLRVSLGLQVATMSSAAASSLLRGELLRYGRELDPVGVRVVLELKADPNEGVAGHNVLRIAVMEGNEAITKLMLDSGVEWRKTPQTIMAGGVKSTMQLAMESGAQGCIALLKRSPS